MANKYLFIKIKLSFVNFPVLIFSERGLLPINCFSLKKKEKGGNSRRLLPPK